MSQTIEITVTPDGQTNIETKGFAGATCQSASRFLEESLGVRQSEQLTAEFHSVESSHLSNQHGQ